MKNNNIDLIKKNNSYKLKIADQILTLYDNDNNVISDKNYISSTDYIQFSDQFIDSFTIDNKMYTNLLLNKNIEDNYIENFINLFPTYKLNGSQKKLLWSKFKSNKNSLYYYMELVDNVIFNIEVDWNDEFNFVQELNLYSAKVSKIQTKNKVKSVRIERPQNINTNIDLKWKDSIVSVVLKNLEKHLTYNHKSYIKELKILNSNQITNIINQLVCEYENLNNYNQCLKYFYEALSSNKSNKLGISVWQFIKLLKSSSKTVNWLSLQLSDFDKLKSMNDFDLINLIFKSCDRNETLSELNDEIVNNRIVLDNILEKYESGQRIAHHIFENEINSAINFDSNNKSIIVGKEYHLDNINYLPECNNIAKWRKNNEKYIKKHSRNNIDINVKSTVNNIFIKLNSEHGIINDLLQLINLLKIQFNNDLLKFDIKNDDIEQHIDVYSNNQYLNYRYNLAINQIYNVIKLHFNNLLFLEKLLDKKYHNTNINWNNEYSEWLKFKNKKQNNTN